MHKLARVANAITITNSHFNKLSLTKLEMDRQHLTEHYEKKRKKNDRAQQIVTVSSVIVVIIKLDHFMCANTFPFNVAFNSWRDVDLFSVANSLI